MASLVISLMILLTSSILVSGQLRWRLLHAGNSTQAPVSRKDAQIAYDLQGNQVVLFGGRTKVNDAEKILGDTWIYSLNTGQWREVPQDSPDLKPAPRYSFVSGISQGFFYVATGEGNNKVFHNDMWRLNLSTLKWDKLPIQQKPSYYSQNQWTARQEHLVQPGGRCGAVGGIYPNSTRFYISLGKSDKKYADIFTYSLTDLGWFRDFGNYHPYSPNYAHARHDHAGTLMGNDELLVYGGCLSGEGTGGPCPSGDSWVFDGKAKEWLRTDGCASPRVQASLAMLPNKNGKRRAVMYGGQEKDMQVLLTVESPADQVAIFNPDLLTWKLRRAEGKIPTKRAAAAMATGVDGVYMFGGYETESGKLSSELFLLAGDAATADQAPEQARCQPTFFSLTLLHGILMTLGWGLFLQIGAFLARYMRRRRPLWFHLHQLFQIFGLLLAIAGLVVGILSVKNNHFTFSHGIIGYITMALGILQPLGAICRPSPPSDGERKSVRRMLWECCHHFLGRSALILGLVNISLGVFLIVSSLLIWALWFGYLGLLLLIYAVSEFSQQRHDNSPESHGSPRKYILRDRTRNYDKRRGFDNPNYS